MKAKPSRCGRWTWGLIVFVAAGLPIPFPGFVRNVGGGGAKPLVTTWHALVSPARAETPDDYVIQTVRAMSRIDGHMVLLTRRFTEESLLTRCSFQVERRKYSDTREALRRALRLVRGDPSRSAELRPKIEALFAELEKAYSRALACYP